MFTCEIIPFLSFKWKRHPPSEAPTEGFADEMFSADHVIGWHFVLSLNLAAGARFSRTNDPCHQWVNRGGDDLGAEAATEPGFVSSIFFVSKH